MGAKWTTRCRGAPGDEALYPAVPHAQAGDRPPQQVNAILLLCEGHEAALQRRGHGLRAVADAQLHQEVIDMRLHRALANIQQSGNLPVTIASHDQAEHIDLAGG